MEPPILNLKIIRSWHPCRDPGKYASEDWEGTALDILRAESVPVQDRLWCVLRNEAGLDDRTIRLFACWCARQEIKLLPENERSARCLAAIEVAERFANGNATKEELSAARDAAWDAARDAARDATWDAALADAWDAVRDTARDAARDAARAAARDAARAAARDAAGDAAWDAAWDAACDAQIKHLIKMIQEQQ